jgi:phage terminase large subunit GpA-like protein
VENSDRVRAVLLEAAKAAAPPPDIGITAWSEATRILGHSSRLSGPYRVIRTPYWKEPMDALSPNSGVQQVIIQKGAQLGASEFLLNVLGYYLDLAPSPILSVQPTLEMARRFSRQRLAEMIELSPALKALAAVPRGGKLVASELFKAFHSGAALILTGANSASSLRSLPAKILLLDEIDGYPAGVDNEGDPCDLAIARTESFGTAKRVLLISTPTEKGLSRIERLYEATDRRRYFVPCPHCGARITLEFENLRMESVEAVYRCQICGEDIQERDKLPMLEAGEWRPTSTCESALRGYHLSQLYSGWTSWRDLLRRHEAAKGVPERERVFQNCSLGLTYSPPALEVPEAAALMARAEPYVEGLAPAGGPFLTCGVDVQVDRIEAEIVAWGKDFESWSIFFAIIHGDTSEPGTWNRLDELLTRQWPHASGMPLQLQATCIDAGYSTSEVAQFARARHASRTYATKSLVSGFGKPVFPRRASWTRDKFAIYSVSIDEAKLFFMNRLRIEKAGPGYVHTPIGRPASWYEQLLAEKLTYSKGQRRWINPQRLRNEALDTRSLAICALHARLLAGVDLNQWVESFERMLAPQPAAAPVNGAPAAPPNVVRSRWMSY